LQIDFYNKKWYYFGTNPTAGFLSVGQLLDRQFWTKEFAMKKASRDPAAFLVRYAQPIDQAYVKERSLQLEGATLQIASPLIDRLPDDIMSPEQALIPVISNLRISNMLPILYPEYKGFVEAIQLAPGMPLQPADKPLFIRDVSCVIEELVCDMENFVELEQLHAKLMAPRMYVHVYTMIIDRRFPRDMISDTLFGALMKLCSQAKLTTQLNDICGL
jgi:hypothetical protein